MTLIGTMMARNMGVAILITIIVLKTLNTVMMNDRKDRGMVSSMIFTSLENLLRMRPRGVVSKNDMGERRMLLSKLEWSVLEAKKPAMATAKDEPKTKQA